MDHQDDPSRTVTPWQVAKEWILIAVFAGWTAYLAYGCATGANGF